MAIDRRYLKPAMVGFVDLLGFSSRVRNIRTEEDLEATERDVRRVQTWLDHKPKDDSIRLAQQTTSKSVLAFSDCVVVTVPLRSQSTKYEGAFDVLMSELNGIALAQGQCVVNRIFVRGGVALGLWYRRAQTMISPAMIEAVELEKDACVPMIALSDDSYEQLAQHEGRTVYSQDIDPIAKLFRRFDDLPNGHGHWFIDYAPLCLESVDATIAPADVEVYRAATPGQKDQMRSEAYLRDCLDWSGWHRDAIVAGHASAPNTGVRAKYNWLSRYHDDTMQRFFKEPAGGLLIGNLPA